MSFPIPKEALDDRFAIVGTAGSGKTYLALGAVEHLLSRKSRVIFIDPLGVAWGLRLCMDGATPSPFHPIIFGGAHGDLPINEHAGALIGQTVATMRESCIVDLSGLGTKASERRFMLAFLTALYRETDKEPVHLIIDEADMFAPQKLLDKDGDAARLLGMVETVVRRGRVKGFIPWLITQRPAVLSKDVLSQSDGLIALKLTAPQDRAALGAWVEAGADRGVWKGIDAALSGFARGHGVVWVPSRGILTEEDFPPKATFDSSRTPKRGEKREARELRPLDLGALRDRLATVAEEAKASDPKVLRARIAELEKGLAKAHAASPTGATGQGPTVPGLRAALAEAREEGRHAGYSMGWDHCAKRAKIEIREAYAIMASLVRTAASDAEGKAKEQIERFPGPPGKARSETQSTGFPKPSDQAKPIPPSPKGRASGFDPDRLGSNPGGGTSGELTNPQRELLRSLAWWKAFGHNAPSRAQIAAIARWKVTGSNIRNRLSELSVKGFVIYPGEQLVSLTPAGAAAAPDPDTSTTVKDSIRDILTSPQKQVFEQLLENDEISRTSLAALVGWQAGGSNIRNRLSELRTLDVVIYPGRETVALQPWVTGK